MNINPYDYMLELRNNKILFSYMAECFVMGFQDDGITEIEWSINSKSSEGEMIVSPLVNNLFRLSLPIPCPNFMSVPMIGDILLGLQPTIEGLITISYKKSLIYFDYNITFDPFNKESLDKALLLFLKERGEIKEGFTFLTQDFNKLQNLNPSTPEKSNEENLSSLWDVMEDIDNIEDDNLDD